MGPFICNTREARPKVDKMLGKNVLCLGMGGLLGMYTWGDWIPKGLYHQHGLGTYLWPNSGFSEGGMGWQYL